MNNKVLFKEGGKLFGTRSQRVTTQEMRSIFLKIKFEVGDVFEAMTLNRSFASKTSHGDVDIIVLPNTPNWKKYILNELSSIIVDQSSNANVHSFLFHFEQIKKNVHVDFIEASSMDDYKSKNQYYSFNDLSAMIGIIAKKNHFKFGSEGFFKRFQDRRGNWHDILISKDLNIGLDCLGFNRSVYENITDIDDAVEFILSGRMFDSDLFKRENMTQDQKKDEKRPNIEYMIGEFRKFPTTKSTVTDEDYFFKKLYPDLYKTVELEKQQIDKNIPQKSKYNGSWLMTNFNIKPGPQVGMILKAISDEFQNLDETDESEIYEFVSSILE